MSELLRMKLKKPTTTPSATIPLMKIWLVRVETLMFGRLLQWSIMMRQKDQLLTMLWVLLRKATKLLSALVAMALTCTMSQSNLQIVTLTRQITPSAAILLHFPKGYCRLQWMKRNHLLVGIMLSVKRKSIKLQNMLKKRTTAIFISCCSNRARILMEIRWRVRMAMM